MNYTCKEPIHELFRSERRVAEEAAAIAERKTVSREEYLALHRQYEKLLRNSIKLVRISDKTQQKLRTTQDELSKVNRLQSIILEKSLIGIALVRDRLFEWVNPRWAEIIGLPMKSLTGKPFRLLFIDDSGYEELQRESFDFLSNGQAFEKEIRLVKSDGMPYWGMLIGKTLTPYRPEQGVVWLLSDVTARKEWEEQLCRQARTDALTGVYSRRHFMELSEQMFLQHIRYGQPMSVMLLDADHFKRVNDVYGHPTGDDVLKTLAATAQRCLRASDVFGRIGGEEFAVTLPGTRIQGARVVAERMRVELSRCAVAAALGTVRFTVSIGVAELNERMLSFETLLKQADLALYQAKENGRNRVESGGGS